MSKAVWPMPVSIEQIAVVLRRMSPEEQRRLVELVPELRDTLSLIRPLTQARMSAEMLKQELVESLKGEALSPDEPFLEGVTLEEYLSLPDAERASLWESWAEEDIDAIEEVDVSADVLPAG
jgi:hypothetical protein